MALNSLLLTETTKDIVYENEVSIAYKLFIKLKQYLIEWDWNEQFKQKMQTMNHKYYKRNKKQTKSTATNMGLNSVTDMLKQK